MFGLAYHHMVDQGSVTRSPKLSFPASSPTPASRVGSAVLPRRGVGPTFPSAAVGEGEGQLPRSPLVAGTRVGRAFFCRPVYHMTEEEVEL